MTPPQPPAGYRSHSWFMLLISAVLFVIAAFAAGGDALGNIPALVWAFAGAAAFVLAWVVP